MDFSFTEEQQMLQESIRRYLESGYTLEHRAKAVAGDGWSPTTWRELADLGLLALDVDEADGGMGAIPGRRIRLQGGAMERQGPGGLVSRVGLVCLAFLIG